jgi:hypothetical protein
MRAAVKGRLVGIMTCLIALVLLAPGQALADLLDDPEGSTEGVVEDTVEDVTEVVTEVVNEVTEAAGDGTDEVATAVDDVVTDTADTANDVTQLGDATGGITGTVDGSSGSDAGGSPASHGRGGSATGGRERAGFLVTITRASHTGSWRWKPVNPLGAGLTGMSGGVLLQTTGDGDPCEGSRSVCLDVLFGRGEFVKLGDDVLGILATTGVGVIGLMVIALLLGVSGSGALVAARARSSFARLAG